MEIFVNHRLNPFAFDEDLRRGTHDLGDVLAAAQRMKARAIESTHFLIAVAGVPGGVTQRGLVRLGLSVAQWESGLSHCTTPGEVGDRPVMLAESGLHPSATALLQAAQELCARSGRTRISEPILLLCSLRQATPPVRELLAGADIDLVQWCRELEEVIVPPPPPPVFQATGARGVVTASFSATGRRVLHLLRSETEALGYETADPRHLLLALLALEGGATQYGLFRQGLAPRKVQEAVLLHLRAKAKRTRSCVPIDMAHLQPALSHILGLAGELAGRDRAGRIAEAHILRAFLEIESTARALLADQKVDLVTLGDTAAGYDPLTDDEDRGEAAIADIETVRTHLKERIVGQDHAIDQIVPYIEFMRFGLTTPGHPIGVFLFCGQSGSGKTEMAKELARAVYGSEEDLIFLEMGQFNSPESMNIFVGAPPGFIGYGEGKLTNGLRDKPKAVVLFDEVEKAHKKVNDALLRFLDEGKIDDPAGPVRDGSQCIVILTSNVSSEHLDAIWQRVAGRPAWRTEIRRALREEFRKNDFRPEFLNRVNEILLFRTLTQDNYTTISDRYLRRFFDRLRRERQIEVILDRRVNEAIGAYCAELNEGARAVHRLAQHGDPAPDPPRLARGGSDPNSAPDRARSRRRRRTDGPGDPRLTRGPTRAVLDARRNRRPKSHVSRRSM